MWLPATTANTKSDGTGTIGTDMLLLFTAGANCAFIRSVILSPQGSANVSTTATVARIYLSTVSSGATTNANTTLYRELALASQSVAHATAATFSLEVAFGFAIPANSTILVSMQNAALASSSWGFYCIGGDY